MDKEKINQAFNTILLELMTHNNEERNGFSIVDYRDDMITMKEKWDSLMGYKEDEDEYN